MRIASAWPSIILVAAISAACGSSSPTAPSSPTTPTAPAFTFQGNWGAGNAGGGSYRITGCSDTGAIATQGSFCRQVSIGTSASMGLSLTQSGTVVTGTVFLGPYAVPVTGTANGTSLTLVGTTPFTVAGFTQIGDLAISNWSTSSSPGIIFDLMTGTFNYVVTVRGSTGSGIISAQIIGLGHF